MILILKIIGSVVFFAAILGCMVFWSVGVFYGIKAYANRKETGHPILDLFTMPQFTEAGLAARRRFYVTMVGFVVCSAIIWLLCFLADRLPQ